MDKKARAKIISQQIRAGKRRIEAAKEHCIKGGFHTHIDDALRRIEIVEQELKQYEREN